jgi:hypothetical protein
MLEIGRDIVRAKLKPIFKLAICLMASCESRRCVRTRMWTRRFVFPTQDLGRARQSTWH